MSISEAGDIVQRFLKSPLELQCGVEIVKEKMKSNNFLVDLSKIATDSTKTLPEQLMAALLLKHIIENYWNTDEIQISEKTSSKNIILENILELNPKISFHLVLFCNF